jgi:hypothetical protein
MLMHICRLILKFTYMVTITFILPMQELKSNIFKIRRCCKGIH